ncbi:MAG TPA: GMC family oxidoreductase [Egibacteraceae bacterium]|nr:GMC family oxidoreductase [Egibacteraceae bacterium]
MRQELEEAAATWAAGARGQRRLGALRALCDTFVPAVDPPRVASPDPYWARTASDVGTERAVAGYIATRLGEEDRAGLEQLLDVLAGMGFSRLPLIARTAAVKALRQTAADVARGLDGLRALTMLHFYALPDERGANPNWPVVGYPGPPDVEAPAARRVRPLAPMPGRRYVPLQADVCIVGSGAGGGVVAGELARAGKDVVVLEAGGHFEEPDFPPYEVVAYRDLYWRGGWTPTADGTIVMAAGATLGGGTTVNWANCVRPRPQLRAEWARHGLTDLDSPAFDEHLDAVAQRISVTVDCSERNGPNARLAEGAGARGWSWGTALLSADPGRYDAGAAGHMGFGDRTGCKQTTTRTYLGDAAEADARIVVGCRAGRILVENGRAAGVEARVRDGRQVTVRAPVVVVAGGALETPALLLRSGIGGPAVGRHLRLHPVAALAGYYPDEQRPWWGAPQTVVVDEFADLFDGYGFLVECPHYGTGLFAASTPWRSGRAHKVLAGRATHLAPFIGIVRDRGGGRVTVDDAGDAVVHYPLEDAVDREHVHGALEAMARLHEAAGARAILDLTPAATLWRRGKPLDRYVARVRSIPSEGGRRTMFSAHQMGTARMGTDPAASVADPEGQLHDTPGVWIGDTSAFPTASGANPMLTCMALARRTSQALLAAG